MRILHIIDAFTPGDALEMLAGLLHAHGPAAETRIVAMGHRSTGLLADQAGIAAQSIRWIPSMGWADPTGWRILKKHVLQFHPTHIHTWGPVAVMAASVAGKAADLRVGTFTVPPSPAHLRMLRIVDQRSEWLWTASSSTVHRALLAGGLNPNRLSRILPGIPLNPPAAYATPISIKNDLGIAPSEGPIILLGGEGPSARHDFGLWSAAILQQMYPHTRAIVREDRRGKTDPGADRFFHALPEEEMLLLAPPEMPWRQLLSVADILLITPDRPTPTGSVLHAMVAGVPVIGTPVECVTELIAHNHNGLLATAVKPRAIAARLEEFMNDSTLKWPLTDRARADVYSHFSRNAMIESFNTLYTQRSAAVAV